MSESRIDNNFGEWLRINDGYISQGYHDQVTSVVPFKAFSRFSVEWNEDEGRWSWNFYVVSEPNGSRLAIEFVTSSKQNAAIISEWVSIEMADHLTKM